LDVPASSEANQENSAAQGRVFGAIPARYGSTRLPGKPLRTIAGRTLIEHVYRRAERSSSLARVVVLTDDERIADEVSRFGGTVEMTPADCASGSDRIAHSARNWDVEAIVNIQGDEPLIEPAAIDRIARHLKEHDDPMVTLAAPSSHEAFSDPNVVKVVVDLSGKALYFSRSPIPYVRHEPGSPAMRHIGIYGYRRDTLLRLADLEPSPLELQESLEQLRALENGIPIRVLVVEHAWQGVDTIQDLKQVETQLEQAAATQS
jgi:3-deoxy-manno-octulosonate cytidylyltransferase (CMP-KDO synthetase)